VDVRVLSATNRDLGAAVKSKTFRADLYYRLAVFPIRLPPLRDRREDIPLLASRFLARSSQGSGKRIDRIDADALDALVRFHWPGNVRELQNEIERAVALAGEGEPLTIAHLSVSLARSPERAVKSDGIPAVARSGEPGSEAIAPPRRDSAEDSPAGPKTSLQDAREAYEAQYISQVLAQYGGNVSHAAVALRVSRVALQKKMKRYRLR